MQAIEVRIPGRFWDSFIYDGTIYLFTLDGDIKSYAWDRLVSSIEVDADCRPLLWQFLTTGQIWYRPEFQKILESPKIYNEVKLLSGKITQRPHEISLKSLRGAHIETAASPSHPHTDVEAFYKTLYVSSSGGVHATPLSRKLSGNFMAVSDIPALRVACSYGSMIIAAGSEGMYDQTLAPTPELSLFNATRQLSPQECIACSWASFDVVGSSGPGDAGFIAAFSKPKKEEKESTFRSFTNTSRQLLDVISSDDLFPSADGLLFGADSLLVMASQSHIYVDGWNPYRRRDDQGVDVQRSLFNRHHIQVRDLTEEAIDGAATTFGIVVEMDSSLIVRSVDGAISAFGEPVNWRTYPRSRRYLNQLHVTYDDYVAIFAFIDDYFLPIENRGPAVPRPGQRQS